jgi:uncharacterized protein (DUF1015 family)
MPVVRPFRAIRPVPDKVHLIVSRSYITYADEALEQKLSSNPYSFIHIINPDFHDDDRADPGSRELFIKVRNRYDEFMEHGYLMQDDSPGFYVYEQTHEAGFTIRGLIAATSNQDYLDGRIKRHEQTLAPREKMFKDYLEVTGFNAEPVLLAYPDSPTVEDVMDRVIGHSPMYDFSTTDRVRHRLWRLDDPEFIQSVQEVFSAMDAFYIADGHHRTASSALLTSESATRTQRVAARDFCMSFLVPASQIHIEPFHRLVRDVGGRGRDEILSELSDSMKVVGPMDDPGRLLKGQMGLYVEGDWFRLETDCPADVLDASYCSSHILAPMFGITDLRSDKRIRFFEGGTGLVPLKEVVDSGEAALAIALSPASIDDVIRIADAEETMPPKTTWVLPKLRSALTIYDLESD